MVKGKSKVTAEPASVIKSSGKTSAKSTKKDLVDQAKKKTAVQKAVAATVSSERSTRASRQKVVVLEEEEEEEMIVNARPTRSKRKAAEVTTAVKASTASRTSARTRTNTRRNPKTSQDKEEDTRGSDVEVVTISSDEEEEGLTPVKTREHKLSSPSPFLRGKIIESTVSPAGPVAASEEPTTALSTSGKRLRNSSTRTTATKSNRVSRQEEDVDSEEEERGHTPVKAKRVRRKASSPLSASVPVITVTRPDLGRASTSALSSADSDGAGDGNGECEETFFQSRMSQCSAAATPSLSVNNSRRSDSGESPASQKGRLCLEVLSSDHSAYIGRVLSIGETTSAGGGRGSARTRGEGFFGTMVVVGSGDRDEGGCDISLEEDEYLSGR